MSNLTGGTVGEIVLVSVVGYVRKTQSLFEIYLKKSDKCYMDIAVCWFMVSTTGASSLLSTIWPHRIGR